MVCGAKRIRSLYLPSPTQRPPGLSTTIPPKGPASLYTINGATMRPWRGDPPPQLTPSRLPFGAAQGPEPVEGEAAPTGRELFRTPLVLAGVWPPRDYELA